MYLDKLVELVLAQDARVRHVPEEHLQMFIIF